MDVEVSFRTIGEDEDVEALVLSLIGWRNEVIGGKDYLIPLDEDHPDYAACVKRAERARKREV